MKQLNIIIGKKEFKMKRFLIFFLLITMLPIFASTLTDLAYKEYKKHYYKKAFNLYKESLEKDKDRLSLLMLRQKEKMLKYEA